jgi:hypothetical protein
MKEIVYASAARRLFDAAELGTLLEQARRNNGRLGVSGILLYESGSFLQVLEGEPATLSELYQRISGDPRHYRVQVLREAVITKRSFGEWSMGFVSLDAQLLRGLSKRHGLSSNGSLLEERAPVAEILEQFRNGQWRNYILG